MVPIFYIFTIFALSYGIETLKIGYISALHRFHDYDNYLFRLNANIQCHL